MDTEGAAAGLEPGAGGAAAVDGGVNDEISLIRSEAQTLAYVDGAQCVTERERRAGATDDAGGLRVAVEGVDVDVATDRERAAVAQQDETLGGDGGGGVVEIERAGALRAAIEVEDRRLGGIINGVSGSRGELLTGPGRDANHACINIGIAAGEGDGGRHVDGQDARAALGEVMVRARTDVGDRTGESGVGIITADVEASLRAVVPDDGAGAGQRTDGVTAAGEFPESTGLDDDRDRVRDLVGTAGNKATGRDRQRTGEGIGAGDRERARAVLGQTARAAEDAGEGDVVGGGRDIDEGDAAEQGDAVAVGRRGVGQGGAGGAGITKGRAVGEADGGGDASAEGAGARDAGIAEGQGARGDGDGAREGVVTGEDQLARAGLDKVRDAGRSGLVLDRGADGEAAGVILVDDDVARRVRADAQTARAADGVGVGARHEQAAAVGAEAEVEGAEGERLRSARAGDLEGEDVRSRGGLGLAAAQGVIAGGDGRSADGREGARVSRAGGGTHAAQDVRRGGRSGAEPVEVRAVGEDRASVAVDVLSRAGGGGGDAGVGGGRHQQGAGVGGSAEGQRAEGERGEGRIPGHDGEHATARAGGEGAQGLRSGETGATDHGETTAGLERHRAGRHQRGVGAAADEIETEFAALDVRGAGVAALGRRSEGEHAGTQLGEDEVGRGGGGEATGEGRAQVIAADGEGLRGAAGVGHEARAGKRTDGFGVVVEVESGRRADGQT